MEDRSFDPLYDQLSDPITAFNGHRPYGIEIDHRDLDLASVSGVDRSRGVGNGQPFTDRQAAAWMDESRVAIWQRDGNPGRKQGPLCRRHLPIDGRQQVKACVTGVRVRGDGKVGVDTHDEDVDESPAAADHWSWIHLESVQHLGLVVAGHEAVDV